MRSCREDQDALLLGYILNIIFQLCLGHLGKGLGVHCPPEAVKCRRMIVKLLEAYGVKDHPFKLLLVCLRWRCRETDRGNPFDETHELCRVLID